MFNAHPCLLGPIPGRSMVSGGEVESRECLVVRHELICGVQCWSAMKTPEPEDVVVSSAWAGWWGRVSNGRSFSVVLSCLDPSTSETPPVESKSNRGPIIM